MKAMHTREKLKDLAEKFLGSEMVNAIKFSGSAEFQRAMLQRLIDATVAIDLAEHLLAYLKEQDNFPKPGEIGKMVALKVTNQPHYWRGGSLQVSKTDLETDITHEVTLAIIGERGGLT